MGGSGVSYAKTVVVVSCAWLACAGAPSPAPGAQPARRTSPTRRSHVSCRRLPRPPRHHRPTPVPRCRAQRRRTHAGGPRPGRAALQRHTLAALGAARAATLAAALASLLATPCQNTELMPEPGDIPLIRAAVLCLINKVRAQNGERPLTPSAPLEQVAENHSREMVAENYFQHVSPAGLTPVDRLRNAGYIPGPEVGYVIGENIAWGTLDLATPQAIVGAWTASSEHLANILEGQYRDTGIGVAPQAPGALANGVPGATYSQEFGVILG
jgi:uncharacterized protein YkwD